MSKTNKIVTVGIKIADLPVFKFNSLKSLSPYDTIIFKPRCSESEHSSWIQQYIEHWRAELKQAYRKGKNIILFLPSYTGYDTSDSKRVNLLNSLFFPVEIRTTEGTDITPNSGNMCSIFKEFCSLFDGMLRYSYVINTSYQNSAILNNKDGDVLGQHLCDFGYGHIIILQDFFTDDMLLESQRRPFETQDRFELRCKELKEKYSNIPMDLKNFIIKLTKELPKTDIDFEQIPGWLEGIEAYDTEEERKCKLKINENKTEIVKLNEENKSLELQLQQASVLKSLLFSTGQQLETAINIALNILGAKAEEYENKEETLQIDNLIRYNDVILIGEDKGLDGFSGNGDIGQLITNTNQYYDLVCSANDDVPKKILFINSERKKELTIRNKEKCCSDKVFKLLKANSVLVVWTPDLFFIAKYVKDSNDQAYAHKCMNCLIEKKYGLVEFPPIPTKKV